MAWRLWDLRRAPDGGLRLVSLTRSTVWDGPVFTADQCPLPFPGCSSGVYALKPGTRLRRSQFDWALGAETWVRGWVALSGQVVEHGFGYRAERAVIRRLRLGVAAHRCFRSPEELARVRDELERRYQCRVKITGVDAVLARGFASPVSLRNVDRGAADLPGPSGSAGRTGEYPYLVITLLAPVYSVRLLLPSGLGREALLALAWSVMDAHERRFRMCLVLDPCAAIYLELDGSQRWTETPPRGGLNLYLDPGKTDYLPS